MKFKFLTKLVSGVLTLSLICQNFVCANGTDSILFGDSAQKLILSKTYELNGKNEISVIKHNGKTEYRYFYDYNNRLIKEIDLLKNETVDYIYDSRGNIISKKVYNYPESISPKQVFRFDYDEKNRITSFDGNEILYDKSGNISKYKNGLTFEWKDSKIFRVSGAGINIEYVYDDHNNRISKSVNGLVTYFRFTEREICQSIGDKVFRWYLPEENLNKSFNYDGKDYKYVCDLQHNVVAIEDEHGKLVANYTYDTWGKVLAITDENCNDVTCNPMHIGNINPLRYRSYYYDSETGFYYLNSRYYDPETGRFLSEDSEEYLKSNNIVVPENLYTYCMNNPVNMSDYDGHSPVVTASVVTLTSLTTIPELALLVAAVIGASAALSLANPAIQKTVNDAVAWAIRTSTTSAQKILAQFRQLTQKICACIGNLVSGYIMYKIKQSIPSKLKTSSGKIDLKKFNSPGKMPGKGPRERKASNGWTIVKVVGIAHKDDVWKLFNAAGKRVASLLADGTIVGR